MESDEYEEGVIMELSSTIVSEQEQWEKLTREEKLEREIFEKEKKSLNGKG